MGKNYRAISTNLGEFFILGNTDYWKEVDQLSRYIEHIKEELDAAELRPRSAVFSKI